jgi:hypothetical protein
MMLRRSFFRLAALLAPRWAWGQSISPDVMRELGAVVLPSGLGRKGTDQVSDDFLKWIREYKEGAYVASGYGHPRTRTVPAIPSRQYASQLQALNAAFARGDKRAAVEAALVEAKIDRIPQRPDGKHVASDLLAHFYSSAAGEDYLYGLAIRRDDCRGLENSPERPAKVTL